MSRSICGTAVWSEFCCATQTWSIIVSWVWFVQLQSPVQDQCAPDIFAIQGMSETATGSGEFHRVSLSSQFPELTTSEVDTVSDRLKSSDVIPYKNTCFRAVLKITGGVRSQDHKWTTAAVKPGLTTEYTQWRHPTVTKSGNPTDRDSPSWRTQLMGAT